jgi:hypothetical protein
VTDTLAKLGPFFFSSSETANIILDEMCKTHKNSRKEPKMAKTKAPYIGGTPSKTP